MKKQINNEFNYITRITTNSSSTKAEDCISDPSLSLPEKSFPDEASAQHWARMQAERIMRSTLNKVH